MSLSKCYALGAADAKVTSELLDDGSVSHKFYVPESYVEAFKQKDVAKMYYQLIESYLMAMEQVEFRTDLEYPGDHWANFGVYAHRENGPLEKGQIIVGLNGYVENVVGDLSPKQSFSVFGGSKGDRIMLGQTSFINHSCKPNVEYVAGGQTKLIVRVKTLKTIRPGEELLVKYSDNYFGPGNKDCFCDPCNEARINADKEKHTNPTQIDG